MEMPLNVSNAVEMIFSSIEKLGILKRIKTTKVMYLRPKQNACVYFCLDGQLTAYNNNPYLSYGLLWNKLPVGMYENHQNNISMSYKLCNASNLYYIDLVDWDMLMELQDIKNCIIIINEFIISILLENINKIHAASTSDKIKTLILRYNSSISSTEGVSPQESLLAFIHARTNLSKSSIHHFLSRYRNEGESFLSDFNN